MCIGASKSAFNFEVAFRDEGEGEEAKKLELRCRFSSMSLLTPFSHYGHFCYKDCFVVISGFTNLCSSELIFYGD